MAARLNAWNLWIAGGLGLWGVVLAGCGPDARVRLVQPHLSRWQRELDLLSNQVYWNGVEGVERVLAEFPLPGATTGKETYVVYLRLPAGVKNPPVAGQAAAAVRGFMIQTRGENAGLSLIVSGTVSVEGTSQARSAMRKLQFEFTCEDGSRIKGRALARRDDWRIHRFETVRRPADVQALLKSTPGPGK